MVMRRRFLTANLFTRQPMNKIWYTSTDGNVVSPYETNVFGVNIVSNTYKDGKGVITFSGDVTTIGELAFYLCKSLTSITIPDSVTEIGWWAFRGCSSLKTVYCKPTTPPTGGADMFYHNAVDRKIYVPYQSLDAYKTAPNWSEYADSIVGYDFENDTVVQLITFTVNGNEHTAENWMTWQDLIDSEYNTYLPSNILYGEGVKWFMIKDGLPSYPRFYMNEYDYHVAILENSTGEYLAVSLDDKIEENYEYYAG